MEPPLGFEVRLFERMGVTDVRPRRRRFRPSRWVPAAVGVAAAALALGLGLSLTSSSPTPTVTAQAHGSHQVVTAAFVENGKTVGHVMTVGGDKPWMSMMLDDSAVHGTVNCVVVTDDGSPTTSGPSWPTRATGRGSLRCPSDPADVRTAEVESPSGTVIATATLG